MIALIDADSLLYKVGFALQDEIDWDMQDVGEEIEMSYYSNLDQCLDSIERTIIKIMDNTGCDDYVLHFTGKGNFRDTNPLGYKQNRVGVRKPQDFDKLSLLAKEAFISTTAEGWEADDVVVYLKTKYPKDYVLCAIDKDVLYQTVGKHYNYGKDEWIEISERMAEWFPYYQTIAGDPTDGYKGKFKVGATGAIKALGIPEKSKVFVEMMKKDKVTAKAQGLILELPLYKDERELWLKTLVCYRTSNGKSVVKQTRREAILTMQFAHMHQYTPNGIELWQPPRKARKMSLADIVKQLKYCNFTDTLGHKLELNEAFIELERKARIIT